MYILLESVASVIDDQTLMVYAKYQKGGFDVDSGRPLYTMSETFLQCLGFKDKMLLDKIINKSHDSRKG